MSKTTTSETIHVVVRNRVTTFLWPYPLERLRMAFAFRPVGYRFMPAFRRGTWDGYIRLLKYNRVPTGLFFALKDEIDKTENIRFEIQYQLQSISFHSIPIDGRDYQLECVRAMQRAAQMGGGLILAATGSGKTRTVGLFFRSTLAQGVFIVDELTLMEQARNELCAVLGESVGIIGHSEWRTERITVATVQSLHRHRNRPEFKIWSRGIELMVIDECFPAGVVVETKAGSAPIEVIVKNKLSIQVLSTNLQTGVCEWKKVTNWISKARYTKLVTVIHGKGAVTCTETHLVWTDGGYVEAGSLVPGMRIGKLQNQNEKSTVLFQNLRQHSQRASKKNFCLQNLQVLWERLFVSFLWRSQRNKNVLWSILSSKIRTAIAPCKTNEYTTWEVPQQRSQITKNKNPSLVQTGLQTNEATQSFIKPSNGTKADRNTSKEWKLGLEQNWKRRKWERVNEATETVIRFARQRLGCGIRNSTWRRTREWLSDLLQSRFGFTRKTVSSGSRRDRAPIYESQSNRSEERSKIEYVRVESVAVHESNSFNQTTDGGEEDSFVYCLEVEDNHNFFANGILVSNCHIALNRRQISVVETMKPKAVFGLTATLQLQQPAVRMRAFALAGPVVFEYSLTKGTEEGHLTRGAVFQIGVSACYITGRYWIEFYRKLIHLPERNRAIEDLVRAALRRGRSVVVLVEWIQHIRLLSDMLADVPHRLVYGAIDVEKRIEAKQLFESGEIRLIIANRVFKKGIDLKRVDCIIDAAGSKSPNDCIQKYGRGVRRMEGKSGLIFFDIADRGNEFERGTNSRLRAFNRAKIRVYRLPYLQGRMEEIVDRAVELTTTREGTTNETKGETTAGIAV